MTSAHQHLKNRIIAILREGNPLEPLSDADKKELAYHIRQVFTIRRQISQFHKKGKINHRLLLNNIIILCNTYGISKFNALYLYVYEPSHKAVLKPIMEFLGILRINDEVIEDRVMQAIIDDMTDRYCLTFPL